MRSEKEKVALDDVASRASVAATGDSSSRAESTPLTEDGENEGGRALATEAAAAARALAAAAAAAALEGEDSGPRVASCTVVGVCERAREGLKVGAIEGCGLGASLRGVGREEGCGVVDGLGLGLKVGGERQWPGNASNRWKRTFMGSLSRQFERAWRYESFARSGRIPATPSRKLCAPPGTLNFRKPPPCANPNSTVWEQLEEASSLNVHRSPSIHALS
mmetsp:Transcript_75303/g.151407  ORF Transcript_75303/g.151407 Transcript_75303/m.151407 type:complete len:220 (+) Transcript_75303:303-962(+)